MRLVSAVLLAVLLALPAYAADVARGRYLAVLGDCAGCHTAAQGAPFTGGLAFHAPFGTVYSTNITPDRDTGLGRWNADDFYRALHEGVAPGGKHLYPAFPYVYFRNITRRDSDDLFAYLRTVRPVHRAATPNRLIFPLNLRFVLVFWNWLYRNESAPHIPPDASAAWKRGEYLVNGLGHCAACHTPKGLLFGDRTGLPLAGGIIDSWFAPDITGGAGGLSRWNQADIVEFLATGRNRHATVTGSMKEKVSSSTSRMTHADLAAIATYLKSLPSQPFPVPNPPRPEAMARGGAVFRAHCQTCHGNARQAARRGTPSLAQNTMVTSRDPTSVLRMILAGGEAPPQAGAPPIKPMPAFTALDDGAIADVAGYIRNAWGNRASAVSATQVHTLRRILNAGRAKRNK